MQSAVDLFRTRSYQVEPVGTLYRGAEWALRALVGKTTSFGVDFGPHRFKLSLQQARRGFGSAGIFVQRRYYEPLLEFGYKLLNKGDRAIDGGANQGIFTCAFASAVGDGGHVYAFEPQSYAVSCIRNNAQINGLKNVTIFEGAISGEMGETFLNLDPGPVSAFISAQPQGTNATRVKTFSIDGLAATNQMQDVQFIKLDVEGAELSALNGARLMLQRAKPRVCLEAWDRKLYDEISARLLALGYKAYVFDRAGALNALTDFVPSPNIFFLS
jgi:FkbM family methyltransferase